MTLRVCTLASGSTGNATFVRSETTSILVDAGISARGIANGLKEIGADPSGLAAICLSHEHDDHCRGLRVFHGKFGTPLYANFGTVEALRRSSVLEHLPWNVFTTGQPFTVGDLVIQAFPVPHDAFEPVGFVVSSGSDRVGIATDVGIPTELLRQRLRGCRLVAIEANHDDQLLQDSSRPWHLKQRIRGRQGHLSNEHAARVVADIAGPELHQVVLVHLSRECNRGELALAAVRSSLEQAGQGHIRLSVAPCDKVSDVWE